jgi:hypothetical protein
MLIFADVFNNLGLVTQFRVVLKTFYEFSVINEDDAQ